MRATLDATVLVGEPEGFSDFVTSMTAPVASGWSVRRVGLAPTGKAPPYHGARQQQSFRNVADSGRSMAMSTLVGHSAGRMAGCRDATRASVQRLGARSGRCSARSYASCRSTGPAVFQ